MKSFQAVLHIFALSSLMVDADNTPNLCTADIPNLTKIRPSETASHPIPNITVGKATYDGDYEHFVVRPPLDGGHKYGRVLIYIPGTTDRPELSSCLIKSAAESLNVPILALSYQYLSSGDSFRNGKCAGLGTETKQVECLEEQHKDAIEGGTYGDTHYKPDGTTKFWAEVKPENALKRRLGDLLAHLHAKWPKEGWGKFLRGKKGMNLPKFKNMILSGHSQGAGHVAYLAKTETLYGAVMISGPQDECTDCAEGTQFWIDEGPYKSADGFFTALGHANEPMYDIMKENWMRMKAADSSINWISTMPLNVGFALKTEYSEACEQPLVTNVAYAPTSTCGGKDHCSTAIDDSVPFVEKVNGDKYRIYEKSVWPAIMRGADENNPCGCTDYAPDLTLVRVRKLRKGGLCRCEGDCYNDKDCAGDLVCFTRMGNETVPGCTGAGSLRKNYCTVRPDDTYLAHVGNTGSPGNTYPLGLCEGDCGNDNERCADGLCCNRRTRFTTVPGCVGLGVQGNDYCIPTSLGMC